MKIQALQNNFLALSGMFAYVLNVEIVYIYSVIYNHSRGGHNQEKCQDNKNFVHMYIIILDLKKDFYLFIFRERREEGETLMCEKYHLHALILDFYYLVNLMEKILLMVVVLPLGGIFIHRHYFPALLLSGYISLMKLPHR